MNSTKLIFTIAMCCAVALTSDAIGGGGKNGNGANGNGSPGSGGQGMGTQLTGTLESYNPQDSSLIIRNSRMDTVHIGPATQIMIDGEQMKPEDIKTGDPITIWYSMQNGRKVANRITEGITPGTNGGRNGCPSPGTGGTGTDTTDTSNGGAIDTTGTQGY